MPIGGRGQGGTAVGTGGRTGAGGAVGGVVGTGGAAAGGSTGGGYAPGNPPVPSAGCGKALDPAIKSGATNSITSGGTERKYIIDIPTNYDNNKPYRLFFTFHWIGSTADAVKGQNYYFLKPLATAANEPAIFIAPQALPGNPNGTWDTGKNTDHVFFDALLAFAKANLCFDTSRVFATGFSFGGMMTYSLSVNHQKDIRAAVGIAPANYNIYVPPKTHEPIAWMQTTGMSDGTCPWVQGSSTTNGAKFIGIEHATDNGCSNPSTVTAWSSGNHLCFDYQGCKTGYPVKVCTFGGGHTNIANDSGSSTNWIPEESWKFFKQF
jgi:poly(3-hydroxybutyrate) depolymerase